MQFHENVFSTSSFDVIVTNKNRIREKGFKFTEFSNNKLFQVCHNRCSCIRTWQNTRDLNDDAVSFRKYEVVDHFNHSKSGQASRFLHHFDLNYSLKPVKRISAD